jgi:hypothetical protein
MVNVIERYQTIGERYKNLEYQLYNFHEAVNSLLSETKIPSLSISRSQSDDEIHLRFLGKKYVIRPELDINDKDNVVGLFASYEIDPLRTDDHLKLKQQVEVDKSGNARPKGHTDGYLWSVIQGSQLSARARSNPKQHLNT